MKTIILLSLVLLRYLTVGQARIQEEDGQWKNSKKTLIEPKVVSVSYHQSADNVSSISAVKSITYRFQMNEDQFTITLHQHSFGNGKLATPQMQCQFTGSVNSNGDSDAHFSLCQGMNGLFHWNSREYFIEPTETSRLWPALAKLGSTLLPHFIHFNEAVIKNPIFSCKLFGDSKSFPDIPEKSLHKENSRRRLKRSSSVDDLDSSFPIIDHDIIHHNVIELLIVVTSNLAKRLKDGLNEYILNNVAIATKMLRHPSIKTSISINVVDIITLDRDYERLNDLNNWGVLTQDAVVDRFCHWIRYKKKYSRYVWDSAILINDGSFSTYAIGITHLRSMCASNNCIAVVDRGFGTGFIIAHEIGHQMNAPHDFDSISSCKNFEKQDQEHLYNTMMSTSLYFEHYPFKWSICSENLINAFLRSDDSWCLKQQNKGPIMYENQQIYDFHRNFSTGLRYDLNDQCTLALGEPSEHCNSETHIKSCSTLYCSPKRLSLCIRSQSIVGDGTPCDLDKRCIHGECIQVTDKVVPQDGGWSEFSEWTNCSRPCNGGIQSSERLCNNPSPSLGGRYCVGTRVQIRSCHIHNCEHDIDVREEICKKFDAKPYVPRVDEESVCRLICIKNNVALKHGMSLTDGTPCYAHRTDICVSSRCYKTGCDRVISSDKVYDNCHVCGGKNDTCTKVMKTFDGSKISSSRGMLVAFKLPKNITNVYIKKVSDRDYPFSEEVYDDYQILLLIDHNTVIRRGETVEPFAGGELYYSGSNKKEETYRISGLIQKEVVVLIRTENPSTMNNIPLVEYHYYIPKKEVVQMISNRYSWKYPVANTSSCYEQCNGKYRTEAVCFKNGHKKAVPNVYCNQNEKPAAKSKPCKAFCGYRWETPTLTFIRSSLKNMCSVRCGDGRLMVVYPCQRRTIVKKYTSVWKFVDEKYCYSAGLSNRPYKVVNCTGECSTLIWSYGSWSNCSVGCGTGFRQRKAVCKDVKGRIWDQQQCLHDLGESEGKEPCTGIYSCEEETQWYLGPWTSCSRSCGTGIQSREVNCQRKSQVSKNSDTYPDKMEKLPESFCLSYSKKPVSLRSCMSKSCFMWLLDGGGKCSVTCGVGSRVFTYRCVKSNDAHSVIEDRKCFESGIERPPHVVKVCEMGTCYHPRWITLPWGKCSESCGNGQRFRSIRCGYNTTDNIPIWLRSDANCRNETMPPVMEHCQYAPCPTWRYGPWSECEGICLFGVQGRSLECVEEDSGKLLPYDACDSQSHSDKQRKCLLSTLCGHWKIGEWSQCSVSCGLGTKKRSVTCHHANGTLALDPSVCITAPPFDEVHCKNSICKTTSFWWLLKSSQCYSHECNSGVQYSDIRCVNDRFEVLADNMCKSLMHPNYYSGCMKSECRQHFWTTKYWSDISCSSYSCPMTIRNRKVTCVDDYGNVYGNDRCDESSKPDDWRLCPSPRNCSNVPRSCKELKMRHPDSGDGEYSLAIDLNWTYFIYCADMKTENPAEYLTLKRPNYSRSSKFLPKRGNTSCTYQEEYEDDQSCDDCKFEDSLRSITYFNKIRVNMVDLSIDIFDSRFSMTIGTSFVPYGTAKDCAGSRSCPQGHFKIDLSDTDFSVSMMTAWNEVYHNYGYRIVRTKGSRIVNGWCGGKCSGCSPLPKLYIEPQMYGRDLEQRSNI